jgi:putative photosynthetic complex assembly protein
MSAPAATERFPRAALTAAAVMIGAALLLAAFARLSGMDISAMPEPRLVVTRDLRFVDLPDGGVAVYDVHQSQPLQILPPGSNGFLRSIMRSLVHERRSNGLGSAQPFRVGASADGRLILQDLATGRRIELEAFGHTNAGVFASFLGEHS